MVTPSRGNWLDDLLGPMHVAEDGTELAARPTLNFSTGIVATDNPGLNRIDVAVTPSYIPDLHATLEGNYSGASVPCYLAGPFWIEENGTITGVRLTRRTSGTAGTTIVTVNKNGTDIFVTPPQVTPADGDNATDLSVDFVPLSDAVVVGDYLDVVLTEAETHDPLTDGPEGVVVTIMFART